MNNERLIELATAKHLAEEKLNMLSVRNTYGLTIDERIKLDIEYHNAQRAFNDASHAYRMAIEEAT